jgi:hypothetical protein
MGLIYSFGDNFLLGIPIFPYYGFIEAGLIYYLLGIIMSSIIISFFILLQRAISQLQ